MKQNIMIGILAIVVVAAVAGFFMVSGGFIKTGTQSTQTQAAPSESAAAPAEETGSTTPSTEIGVSATASASVTKTIDMTDTGFAPATISIKKGDSITFVNAGSDQHWPASAVHPTHTVYPGSGLDKCGTGAVIFDSCRGLAAGESFAFKFDSPGLWKFHDHLNAAFTGSITVE